MMKVTQEEVVQFIRDFMTDNEYCPSYQEVADHFGMGKTSIKYRLDQLEAEGQIERRGHRAIKVLEY